MSILVSVQAAPESARSWMEIARAVESAGFDGLYVADHSGTSSSPFVALAAAAAVTRRIRVGTCVINAGAWEPIALASEIATLDLVSDGRCTFGIGAGHTPTEWTHRGLVLPSGAERVDRLEEVTRATVALLAGESVTTTGRHVRLVDARLTAPPRVQERIPLLVGGNGTRVLTFAARHADVVGITGLGPTLADGHHHRARWSTDALERTVELVDRESTHDRRPAVEALVQTVVLTDDAEQTAHQLAPLIPGTSPTELVESPYSWIGTADEIATKVDRLHRRFGIARYVVRSGDIDSARAVIDATRSLPP